MTENCPALIELFAREFAVSHRTRLVPGGDEPLYRPAAGPDGWHEIVFRHDYFQSALHELAHWCVAGAGRRLLTDYGYWYSPDGRTLSQQAEFERVEARPQAVEWLLTVACGRRFEVSLDNLDAAEPLDEASLWRAVHREVQRCLAGDVPPRAAQLVRALAAWSGVALPLAADQFRLPSSVVGAGAGAGAGEALDGMMSLGGVNSTV